MKNVMLTIKWGTEFSADHVNILFKAACSNTSQKFDFVCLTDNPDGLDDGIISYPIPQTGLKEFPKSQGAWPKVCLFHPDLLGKIEQVLFLDIDTVITGNIDPLFNDPGDKLRMLSCGPRWRNFDASLPCQPASGVLSYNLKCHTNIFEQFKNNPDQAYSNFELEQTFLGNTANAVDYFPLEWVQSFKYHLRRQFIADIFLPPKNPSEKSILVAFHGYPRPHQIWGQRQQWARFPRCGVRRPKWMMDYFEAYSKS